MKWKERLNLRRGKPSSNEERIDADHDYTGLVDRHGNSIRIGDTVRLALDNGDVRCFKVCFKTIKRKIINDPIFEEEVVDVYITAVVFCWNGHDLFPCINQDGVPDTDLMEII